ncbi:MAG: EamA family transporter [Epsilonproteobacteria bacterium]|nr:MAG: EamA family transporter [Campylobacterota bacterium]
MKTYFLVSTCVLFWSINFVLGRFVKDDITPFELAFFRWFFVFAMISPILITRHKKILNCLKQNFIILTTLSILGITAFNTLLYSALTKTTTTNALIINSTVPILILIMSFFILKQNIYLFQTIGIVFSTFGVIFLILKADISNIFVLQFNSGDIVVVIASITWALYSVLMKLKPKELDNLEYFAIVVAIGFVLLLPVYLYQGYSWRQEIEMLENNYWVFLYVSIFASVLSYYLWHLGIEKIGPTKTGQFTHLMPIFGIVIASIFLNETLEMYHMIGAVFIAAGIYLSLFYASKSK